jgi:hypothetical protein
VKTNQPSDLARARWRRSSHSYSGNACVEVTRIEGTFAVRDSKSRAAGHLTFTAADWTTFITSVKNGTHDH